MTDAKTRNETRDSLLLLAQMCLEGSSEPHRVRVRNLSDGGMMGEGTVEVLRGDRVVIGLRDIEGLGGTIAWVQGERFGIAFDQPIDSAQVRRPNAHTRSEEREGVMLSRAHRAPPPPPEKGPVRKV